jgi:hypothetical protein
MSCSSLAARTFEVTDHRQIPASSKRALLCEAYGELGHRLVLLWLLICVPVTPEHVAQFRRRIIQ